MSKPTDEQFSIISETSSCVVIAKPGSGKTFTLSIKIADILKKLPWYQGVIAISYTNKASDELKNRILLRISDKKSSFFGTIDKFCLSEIVVPFLRHLFGMPRNNLKILSIKQSDIAEDLKGQIIALSKSVTSDRHLSFISERYQAGEIYLETVGALSEYLIDNVPTLRKYLKSRFTHIIIDEYQDSGLAQHTLFLKLHSLGIVAIAVGDLDQSIYGFADKSSKFLQTLAASDQFKKYSLTMNHRCHQSISAYSLKLINPEINMAIPNELRVYHKHVDGTEIEISKWIDVAIPRLKSKFEIVDNSQFAILTRSNRTAKIISDNLKQHPAQLHEDTPLESVNTSWSHYFIDCLNHIFNKKTSFNDMIQNYMDIEASQTKAILSLLINFKRDFHRGNRTFDSISTLLIDTAKTIFPNNEDQEAVIALLQVTSNTDLVKNYFPPEANKVQVLTLHKSKGLEFEIVFHLDLYQYIIPSFEAVKNANQDELIQSTNLHYVGITRARKGCILCTSTKRFKADFSIVKAEISEFLTRRPALTSLRKTV